jgi:hypothetical protein
VLADFITALTMEAANTSEMLVNFYQIHGATIQKTATFKNSCNLSSEQDTFQYMVLFYSFL